MSLRNILLELPIAKLVSIYYFIRALIATKDRPKGPVLVIDENVDDTKYKLGQVFFNGKFPYSWNYRGENLNMRREYYDDSFDWPWRQLHIRGFKQKVTGKIELQPHEEVSPTGDNDDTDKKMSHQLAHLRGKESDIVRGVEMTKEILDSLNIDYTEEYYGSVGI